MPNPNELSGATRGADKNGIGQVCHQCTSNPAVTDELETWQKSNKLETPAAETGTSEAGYYQVQRDWVNRTNGPARANEQNSSRKDATMMQRWLEETMQDQPYNNVGSVAKQKTYQMRAAMDQRDARGSVVGAATFTPRDRPSS
jgi:hypothetical protein